MTLYIPTWRTRANTLLEVPFKGQLNDGFRMGTIQLDGKLSASFCPDCNAVINAPNASYANLTKWLRK